MAVTGFQLSSSSTTTPEQSPGAGAAAAPDWRTALACTLAVVAGAWAEQFGGWPAVAAVVALAGAAGWYLGRRSASGAGRASDQPEPADTRLSMQIVPVWKRNLEAARTQSERSFESLLESFSSVSGHLDQALGTEAPGQQLELGGTDELLERHRPQIETLLATTRHAVQLKDEMLEHLLGVREALGAMATLTKEVQAIGRATHLLALNATVEATRTGTAGGGIAAVAKEVRQLAGESREAGNGLGKQLAALKERLDTLSLKVRRSDTDEDEIVRQADENARAVVAGLLRSLADAGRSSRQLRDAGRRVQADLEKIFMGLQSQDRQSQMLGSVTDDMGRFSNWLHGATDPAAAMPALWLERLEASYTMEDMRSSHHGTVAIDRNAGVEFF
jgi:methyl-accepting chemotaxis protein